MKYILTVFSLLLTFSFTAVNAQVSDDEAHVTRGEFVQMTMTLGYGDLQQCRKRFMYPDVDWSDDYGNALQTASCMGIVEGDPDGYFSPDRLINYAEASKIVLKAFNVPMTLQANIVDPQWYDAYIMTMKRIDAMPREDIKPSDIITHKEAAHVFSIIQSMKTTKTMNYVGMTTEEAMQITQANGVPFRVVMEDGQPLPATADYRPGRVNATVNNGIITDYQIEGEGDFSQTETLVFHIAPEQVDCVGVGPMKCMVVNGEYFYDTIAGFEFEPGFEYQIEVSKTPRPEPIPADAGAYIYTLNSILLKTKVENSSNHLLGTWMWQKTNTPDGRKIEPQKTDAFTITFNADSAVSGTTDCNNFFGMYDTTKEGLVFGPLATTKKACFGDTQETVFIEFLSQAEDFSVDGDVLYLQLGTHGQMTFHRQ